MNEHVDSTLCKNNIRITSSPSARHEWLLHSRGLRSIVLAKLVYASPAWLGVWSASDVNKLDKFFNRCKRLNYCNQTTACITEQFDQADESIFQTVTSDSHHVLHRFLPAIRNQRCKLRSRTRSFTVTCKIVANRPFAITVILSHVYCSVTQWRLMNAFLFVNCFNYMHFWFVLFNAVCHCSIKAIWWWWWWWWW